MALSAVVLSSGCKDKEAPTTATAAPPAATAAPDLRAIANSVVTRTLGIREGDVVAVFGSPRDLELMEDLMIEVMKVGGRAMPILQTERMARMSFDEVPEKYDTLRQVWGEVITSTATAQINIDAVDSPDLLADVPPARFAARAKAALPVAKIFYERGVRSVDIGNGMYPTHATAASYGMSRDELAAFFWSAMNPDYASIRASAKRLQDAIAGAKEIHITDANGTDIRMGVTRAKWRVSDGSMTEENIKDKDVQKYLPAGELFTSVDAGTAEGTIVADYKPYQGKVIKGFTAKVSKGMLVSMTGSPEIEPLKKAYDAETNPGKAQLSVLDFGLNSGIKATAAKTLRTWVPEGMVNLNFGSDLWAGGSNNAPISTWLYLASATVTADGKVIIENGNIKK